MKYIYIEMNNGETWRVPASFVAADRAFLRTALK